MVCLTDGRGTGAEKAVAARLGRALSKDQIGLDRFLAHAGTAWRVQTVVLQQRLCDAFGGSDH